MDRSLASRFNDLLLSPWNAHNNRHQLGKEEEVERRYELSGRKAGEGGRASGRGSGYLVARRSQIKGRFCSRQVLGES